MTDSIKRWTPGTNPLAAMTFTAEERNELLKRVRDGMAAAQVRSSHARRGTTMPPKRLAALRAERAAAREQALARARSFRVGGGER